MFPDTHWSQLAEATLNGSETGREALGQMYSIYRKPVRSYILSRGWPPHEADDLTQSFFLHAIENHILRRADQERGRFRSFLLTILNRYLLSERDRRRAAKRGGGEALVTIENLDTLTDGEENPADVFDKEWALATMQSALSVVAGECRKTRGEDAFGVISRFLGVGGEGPPDYQSAAEQLGMTAGALRTDVCHWRAKLRTTLTSQVRKTVSAPHEVQEEMA